MKRKQPDDDNGMGKPATPMKRGRGRPRKSVPSSPSLEDEIQQEIQQQLPVVDGGYNFDPNDQVDIVDMEWDLADDARGFMEKARHIYNGLPEETLTRHIGSMRVNLKLLDHKKEVALKDYYFQLKDILQQPIFHYEYSQYTPAFDDSDILIRYRMTDDLAIFDKKEGGDLVAPITIGTFLEENTNDGFSDGSDETAKGMSSVYKDLRDGLTFQYATDVFVPFDAGLKLQMQQLGDPLSVAGGVHPGINCPALLVGGKRACSSTHIEQWGLGSWNYMIYVSKGSEEDKNLGGKLWIYPYMDGIIHSSTNNVNKRIVDLLRKELIMNRDEHDKSEFWDCPAILDDKLIHLTPEWFLRNGFKVAYAIQRVGELIITFPRGVHSVVNLRRCIAVAKNWLPVDESFDVFKELDCKTHVVKENIKKGKKTTVETTKICHTHSLHGKMSAPKMCIQNWVRFNKTDANYLSLIPRPVFEYIFYTGMDFRAKVKVLQSHHRYQTVLWAIIHKCKPKEQQVVIYESPRYNSRLVKVQQSPIRAHCINFIIDEVDIDEIFMHHGFAINPRKEKTYLTAIGYDFKKGDSLEGSKEDSSKCDGDAFSEDESESSEQNHECMMEDDYQQQKYFHEEDDDAYERSMDGPSPSTVSVTSSLNPYQENDTNDVCPEDVLGEGDDVTSPDARLTCKFLKIEHSQQKAESEDVDGDCNFVALKFPYHCRDACVYDIFSTLVNFDGVFIEHYNKKHKTGNHSQANNNKRKKIRYARIFFKSAESAASALEIVKKSPQDYRHGLSLLEVSKNLKKSSDKLSRDSGQELTRQLVPFSNDLYSSPTSHGIRYHHESQVTARGIAPSSAMMRMMTSTTMTTMNNPTGHFAQSVYHRHHHQYHHTDGIMMPVSIHPDRMVSPQEDMRLGGRFQTTSTQYNHHPPLGYCNTPQNNNFIQHNTTGQYNNNPWMISAQPTMAHHHPSSYSSSSLTAYEQNQTPPLQQVNPFTSPFLIHNPFSSGSMIDQNHSRDYYNTNQSGHDNFY